MAPTSKKKDFPGQVAVLSQLNIAISDKVKELNMGKLQSVAQRIADVKKQLEDEADKLATKVEGLVAKAPAAFDRGHAILDQHSADVDAMESELRQLSNLPLEQ